MKLLLRISEATLAAVMIAAPAADQGTQPPAAVGQALQAKYPGAAQVRWKVTRDHGYVAEFTGNGRNVQATFAASGTWLESAVEIGAIELPAPVRTAVVRTFAGYQFADTRRVERATAPPLLYQVRLERPNDIVTVRYLANGQINSKDAKASSVAPIGAIAGTWRGTSSCEATGNDCRQDQVVYRLTPVPTDSTAFDLQTSAMTDGREEPMAALPCTLDRDRAALLCSTARASWRFQVRHDSLIGGLIGRDGTLSIRVLLRRQP